MEIIFTKTGSAGNSTVIQSKGNDLLLIDCGIKPEIVDKAIGFRIPDLIGCLVTHAHADHAAHCERIAMMSVHLYVPDSAPLTVSKNSLIDQYIHKVSHAITFPVRNRSGKSVFAVTPFSLIHYNASDGLECQCFGFLIRDIEAKELLIYATDTAAMGMTIIEEEDVRTVGHRFPACEKYMLECNYIKNDDFSSDQYRLNREVEMRRFSSHMSAQTVSSFIRRQNLSKCNEIHLMHLSSDVTSSEIDEMIGLVAVAIQNNGTAVERITIYANEKRTKVP